MLLYPLVVILLADLSSSVCKSVCSLVCKSMFIVCLWFFTLTNMNNPTCFFQLRKLQEKALRYTFHQDNYHFFSVSRVIPTGLQISHTPKLENSPPSYRKNGIKFFSVLPSSSLRSFLSNVKSLSRLSTRTLPIWTPNSAPAVLKASTRISVMRLRKVSLTSILFSLTGETRRLVALLPNNADTAASDAVLSPHHYPPLTLLSTFPPLL